MLSGAHVALGRHVSTCMHVVFGWESQLVGGSPHHSHDSRDGRHSGIRPYSPLMPVHTHALSMTSIIDL